MPVANPEGLPQKWIDEIPEDEYYTAGDYYDCFYFIGKGKEIGGTADEIVAKLEVIYSDNIYFAKVAEGVFAYFKLSDMAAEVNNG